MSSSIFAGVEQGPAIEVFALNRAFQEDSNPKKANLGVGGKFLVHNLLHCMPCGLCNLLSSPCKSILLHFVRMYAFSSSISPPTPPLLFQYSIWSPNKQKKPQAAAQHTNLYNCIGAVYSPRNP